MCFRGGGRKKRRRRGELIERDGEKEKKMGKIWGKKESDTCKREKEDKKIRWDLWREREKKYIDIYIYIFIYLFIYFVFLLFKKIN